MEILIAVLGLVIAFLGFWYQFLRPPIEELQNLKIQFLSTRDLSIKLKDNLYEIAEKQNCWDDEVIPQVTYRSYIKMLEKSQGTNLSMELFKKIDNKKLPKDTILSMVKSLEIQFNDLLEMNTRAEFKIQELSSQI